MSRFTIIIDGREQKDHAYGFESFPVDTKRKNLDTLGSEGDYTIEGYEDRFAVERKALNDLAACCGSRREHFEGQVELGTDILDAYAVVIEAPRWKAAKGAYYSNINPNSVTGTVREWQKEPPDGYGAEMYWCDDKYKAEVKTYSLLDSWKAIADAGGFD